MLSDNDPNLKSHLREVPFDTPKTDQITAQAQKTLHPYWPKNYSCTMMLLRNLAEPEWISVPCRQKLLLTVVCRVDQKSRRNETTETTQQSGTRSCPKQNVLKGGTCYFFLKFSQMTSDLEEECSLYHMTNLKGFAFGKFRFLFDAVSVTFPPILYATAQNSLLSEFTYEKYESTYIQSHTVNTSRTDGIHICESKETDVHVQGRTDVFGCASGGFVSYFFVCDGEVDCSNDQSDELLCSCSNFSSQDPESILCNNKKQKQSSALISCSPLYYLGHDGTCHKYFVENIDRVPEDKELYLQDDAYFLCSDESVIHTDLVDDLVADCNAEGQDEPVLVSLLRFGEYRSCNQSYQIPCIQGHPRCYNVSEICVFKLNHFGHTVPCRTGNHLQKCQTFECNLLFKCPDSYCIEWSFVCDGKWDCPHGIDEINQHVCGSNLLCKTLFRCRKIKRCIHLKSVCDGQHDCPENDDEHFCQLHNVTCPSNCWCLGFAISCSSVKLHLHQTHYPFQSVHLSHSSIFSLKFIADQFSAAVVFSIAHTNITGTCYISFGPNVLYLDVGYNLLTRIQRKCFELFSVRTLLLNNNFITFLESEAFKSVPHLLLLNLSNNPLTNFPVKLFADSVSLKLISAEEIQFIFVDLDAFQGVSDVTILSTDHYICCIAPKRTNCRPKIPWHKSCSDLLPDTSMKIFLLFVSLLIILLNTSSIMSHLISSGYKKAFLASLISLNVNNILCGFYLGIIWTVDLYFKGTFFVKERLWRTSNLCYLAFFLTVVYIIFAQLSLLLLTVSRLMVVMHPMNTIFKRTMFTAKTLVSMAIVSILVAFFMTYAAKHVHNQVPNNLCSPFIDFTNSLLLVKYFNWFTVVSQTSTSTAIFVMHIILVKELYKAHKNVSKSKEKNDSRMIIGQLALITASNVLCWFPANGVFVAVMEVSTYSPKLLTWTVLAGMPVNSVITPCVFVGSAVRKLIKGHPKNSKETFQTFSG